MFAAVKLSFPMDTAQICSEGQVSGSKTSNDGPTIDQLLTGLHIASSNAQKHLLLELSANFLAKEAENVVGND